MYDIMAAARSTCRNSRFAIIPQRVQFHSSAFTARPFLRTARVPAFVRLPVPLCLSVCAFAFALYLPSALLLPAAAQSTTETPKPRSDGSRRMRKTAALPEQNETASPVLSPLVRVCLLRYAGASQIVVSALPGAHLLGGQGREAAAGSRAVDVYGRGKRRTGP